MSKASKSKQEAVLPVELENNNLCIFCGKTFKTPLTLKCHKERSKKCINNRDNLNNTSNSKFECVCGHISHMKADYKKHNDICKLKTVIDRLNENSVQLKNLQIMLKEREAEVKEKDKQIEMLKSLLDTALLKPSSVTNNNVKGNQTTNICQFLSDKYEEYTAQDRIEQIARESIEKYFWEGQIGISRFCVDHIITTEEGKKIICCTDMSRRKFKYLKDERLIEDIEARVFTEKISVPIKKVCREVYDTVIKKIDAEREEKTDAFELNLLNHKTSQAQEKLLEIINIDDNNHNTQYKNELSVLLKI